MASKPKNQDLAPTEARELKPIEAAFQMIDRLSGQISTALPSDVDPERFISIVKTAINQNRELLDVEDKQSLYNSCVRAAQDGLVPDGREGALVIFRKNVGTRQSPKWINAVQWMPMVNGLVKRAAKSGIKMDAHIVCENDDFDYALGDDPHITHRVPKLGQPRGKPIGAYAIATLPDGTKKREVMTFEDIEKIRAASKSSDAGPWKTWWDEMARKSAIRRLFKLLPLDMVPAGERERFRSAIHRDDELYDFEDTGAETTPARQPGSRPRGLQAVVDATPEVTEPATGEVIDHDTGEVTQASPSAGKDDIFDD